LGSFLQIRAFFGHNRPCNRANLEANATINAGGKINPVPIGALHILARTGMDASDWASIDTIGNAFANFSNNCMRHSSIEDKGLGNRGFAILNFFLIPYTTTLHYFL